jgi:hypothetical protein
MYGDVFLRKLSFLKVGVGELFARSFASLLMV